MDIDIESAKKEILESPNIRSSDKQLIQRSKDIEREARVLKLALSKAKSKERGKDRQSQGGTKEQKKSVVSSLSHWVEIKIGFLFKLGFDHFFDSERFD